MSWQNLDRSRPDAAHYSVMKCVANEMTALREMFPEAKADDLNFVLFSTSGVHGTYMTIEAAEEEKTDVTFVIVHPRLVSMRYGNVQPETPDDWAFLKKLRQSSWDVAKQIGATAPPQQEQAAPHPDEFTCPLCFDDPANIKAAPGAVQDGWMPIETAPKTTKSILVHCSEMRNTYVVAWSHTRDGGEGWVYFCPGNYMLIEEPTHWMPLPAAPKAQEPGA